MFLLPSPKSALNNSTPSDFRTNINIKTWTISYMTLHVVPRRPFILPIVPYFLALCNLRLVGLFATLRSGTCPCLSSRRAPLHFYGDRRVFFVCFRIFLTHILPVPALRYCPCVVNRDVGNRTRQQQLEYLRAVSFCDLYLRPYEITLPLTWHDADSERYGRTETSKTVAVALG